MHGIYNYVPETNHVSRVYSVAAILYLQFVLHVILFPKINILNFHINTSRSMCAAPNIAIFLCSPLISCFPGMLSGIV
jgi:hypothetical protein